MSDFDLVVRGATSITVRGRHRLDLWIRHGKVAHVGPLESSAETVVDGSGLLLLPGMVDTHVHLMDPGPTEREDFPTGTAAAAANGVTTIVEHTHGHPLRSPQDVVEKRRHLEGRSWVDYGLAAHAWPDRIGEIAAVWREGVTFFKLFTCTTHGIPGFSPAGLLSAFEALAAVEAQCLVHCEDESITEAAELALRQSGRVDGAVIPEWRSREAELVAAGSMALLARLTGVRSTVAHVSSPEVAELVARERSTGIDIGAEACPQYFLLREHDVLDHGAFRKFTPPVRARSNGDERAMWDLLRRGVLTHMSTDHAPATRGQKTDGDIWCVHFGLPGLDSTLRLLVDAALRGELSFEDVTRVYSSNPARRYRLYPRKGHLGVGADADFVLVDPDAVGEFADEQVISKAGWTPYAGRQVRGRIVSTHLRGALLAEGQAPTGALNGEFLPGPGAEKS